MMMRFLVVGLLVLSPLLGLQAQTIRYIHTDALGSVAVVSDANRNVIERREYEPYGAVLTGVKDGPGYTGHVLDAATSMSYMQQRYYDPGLGRFLSADPMATDLVTAWNFNRYIYAASNPYKFTDPDGRVIRFAEGTPADFMRNFAVAIRYLNEKGVATPIGMAWSSKEVFTLQPASDRANAALDSYNWESKTVTWADKGGLEIRDFRTGGKGLLSPALAVGHEFDHAINHIMGGRSFHRDGNTYDGTYSNQEERNVIEEYERPAAKMLGEGMRGDHSGKSREFTCPTLKCVK